MQFSGRVRKYISGLHVTCHTRGCVMSFFSVLVTKGLKKTLIFQCTNMYLVTTQLLSNFITRGALHQFILSASITYFNTYYELIPNETILQISHFLNLVLKFNVYETVVDVIKLQINGNVENILSACNHVRTFFGYKILRIKISKKRKQQNSLIIFW